MIDTRFYEEPDGGLTVVRLDDCESVLERNKALQSFNDGYSPSRELRRAASIPAVIVEKWKNELGIDVLNPDHLPKVKQLLNSSEWAYLRTAPGRL